VFKGYTWATDQEVVTMIRGLTKQPITMETERLWNNDYNGEIDAVMDVFNTHNDKSQRYYWLGGWARKMTDSNIIFIVTLFSIQGFLQKSKSLSAWKNDMHFGRVGNGCRM